MKFLWLIALTLLVLAASLVAWNRGFDLGEKFGWSSAILANKLEIDCKFPLNWEKRCKEKL